MPTDPRRALGERGERLARHHLRSRGYSILERNFRTRHGELDVIAANDGWLVFCEVKTRVSRGEPGPFGPLVSIGVAKRKRLRAMAREWLGERSVELAGATRRPPETRFDAIGVTMDAQGRLLELEHLEGAF
jgi:putative endonuclease